ncbi:MAG: response regulator [Thermomicrobiales bacterium]
MTAPMIALLDNDPSFLSLMHDVLTDEGYRTLLWHPEEGSDAHALLRRVQPHLVVLDLWLKRRDDGWDFLKRLWADFDTTQIPAIIVAGQPDVLPAKVDVLRAMRCQVVRKPFHLHDLRDLHDLHDLLAAIERVLGLSPVKCRRGEGAYAVASGDPFVMDGSDDPADVILRERA